MRIVSGVQPAKVDLTEEQLDVLDGLSDLLGRPIDELIREAVDQWLAAQATVLVVDDEWDRRMGVLLERRRQLAEERGWTQENVETVVAEEVGEVRAARRAGDSSRP